MNVETQVPPSTGSASPKSPSQKAQRLTVSKADVISFRPCDSESINNIDLLMAGNERVDAIYVLNVSIPAVHKLWLVLRAQLIPIETLDKIKAAFIALIPPESQHYQRAIEVKYDYDKVAQVVMQALRPEPTEDVGRRLVEIVRSFIEND